ncbi:VOC family protein [Pseudomonas sp. REB1044]|uniref:VOC family protein n=1 Tax=Pseudomonas sp. REB1044 TaxID=2675224 RepID=UPI00315D8B89
MKIVVTRILVDDQAKALAFYHYILGFQPKDDIPMGRHRRLTLTSPNDPNGVELLLEPDSHPAAQAYKAALKAEGIPATSFAVRDIQAEYTRLCASGVQFAQPPTVTGPTTVALFDDTCGNLIQLSQRH